MFASLDDLAFTNINTQVLPSGVRKLEVVTPDEENENIKRARNVGITGLAGTIDSTDWAYTTGAEAQLVMMSIANEQLRARLARQTPNLRNAWITAEKADKNECVVIDFREFVNFYLI